jgi:hypothetical protein
LDASKSLTTFDYGQLDDETAGFLRQKEYKMRMIVGKAYTELGRELKEAQDELARRGYGCFEAWYVALGFKRQTVYRLIERYDNLILPNWEKRDLIEDLPVSLTYEIAAPSAESTEPKRKAKQAVLNGDVKTLKEYRELVARLEQAEERARRAEQERDEALESAQVLRDTLESMQEQPQPVREVRTGTEISGRSLEFSAAVRDFIKKYSFLIHFDAEFASMNELTAKEYETAIDGMYDFLDALSKRLPSRRGHKPVIINVS